MEDYKTMVKKVIVPFLVLTMVVAMSSCGKVTGEQSTTPAQSASGQQSENTPGSEGTTNTTSSEQTGGNTDKTVYDYTPGTLNTVVDKNGKQAVNEFHIEGLQILSDPDYDECEAVLADPDFRTEGINSVVKGDRYIRIYADLGSMKWDAESQGLADLEENLRIVTAPHKSMEEYEAMSYEEMEAYWLDCQDEGSGSEYCPISWEGDPLLADYLLYSYDDESLLYGTKDILFVWKQKIAQFVVVNFITAKEYEAGGYNNGVIPEETDKDAELSGEIPEDFFRAFNDAETDDGYTWPSSEMWESVGLPALDYDGSGDNVTVLNFGDSLSVEGYAEAETLSDTIDSLTATLTDAGLDVETRNTLSGETEYVAEYEYHGIPLMVKIGSSDSAQINVFVNIRR